MMQNKDSECLIYIFAASNFVREGAGELTLVCLRTMGLLRIELLVIFESKLLIPQLGLPGNVSRDEARVR